MGVRPPQDNSSEPDAIEFGIAAVSARLDETDLTFPATTTEVLQALDETSVPYDAAGNTLDLEAALTDLRQTEFDSEAELLDRLHPIFEEHRTRATGSLLSRVRALLPF